jgi:hypothetical protein
MHLIILHQGEVWYLRTKDIMYFSGRVPTLAYFNGKIQEAVHSSEEDWDKRGIVTLSGGMQPLLISLCVS